MSEIELLTQIYELLLNILPFINFITGCVQFIIVVFIAIVLYKLFKIFF